MKKIAVICTLYGYNGGTGRVTVEIIERYASDGNEVHVFCAEYEEELLKITKVKSITKIPITKIGILKPLDLLLKSTSLVKKKEYDFVYSTGDFYYNPDIITIHTLKKVVRKKIRNAEKEKIVKNNNGIFKTLARTIYCPLLFEIGEQFVYRQKNTLYIGVSKGVASEFKSVFKHSPENIIVIDNGVDSEKMKRDEKYRKEMRKKLNIAEEERAFLFIGSDWGIKRLDTAIEIVSKIPNSRLIVAGHDNAKPYMDIVSKMGLEKRITFIGFVRDVEKYYSACDFFIFTSIYETFGLVALEAMAAGMVVFSNSLHGVEDFIIDGENGFICSQGVNEFIKKIKLVLSDKKLEDNLRKNAVLTAEQLTWDKVYRKYKMVFDNFERM